MSEVTPEELARCVNLRDLGGVLARDGRKVRRGAVYRSAALAELAPNRLAAIRALEIRSVVDLRSNGERAVHPTPWAELGCRDYWSRDHNPIGRGDLNDLLDNLAMTTAAAHALMVKVYAELPYGHIEVLQRAFRTIAHDEGPVLFHCTAGKDRTGMTAALLLSALGAPREAILADYLATNQYDILGSPAFRRVQAFTPERLEALQPIFTVSGDYLDAMFEGIAGRDGSVEGFLRDTLQLDKSDLEAVSERLLS